MPCWPLKGFSTGVRSLPGFSNHCRVYARRQVLEVPPGAPSHGTVGGTGAIDHLMSMSLVVNTQFIRNVLKAFQVVADGRLGGTGETGPQRVHVLREPRFIPF